MEVGGPTCARARAGRSPAQMALDGGQVQWWAFGEKLPNMAFTAATRTQFAETNACCWKWPTCPIRRGQPL